MLANPYSSHSKNEKRWKVSIKTKITVRIGTKGTMDISRAYNPFNYNHLQT
jgi:hypothetical protein